MQGVLFTNGSKYSGGSFNGHTCKRKALLTAAFTKPRLGTLRSNDADGNENVKKTKGLMSKTTTLHVHHAFLYISFLFLDDFDVKMPNFAF